LDAAAAITPADRGPSFPRAPAQCWKPRSIGRPHYHFAADHAAGAGDGAARKAGVARATPDLAYTVELWDAAKASVEITLALTANGSIGFAAYYAATREFPDRYITLRHRDGIVSRWNGPGH
jgi:hypothetical protein